MRGSGPFRRIRSALLALMLAAALLGLSAGSAAAKPGAYKVLFVSGLGVHCPAQTFPSQLASETGIAAVNTFDASTTTPTVAQLDPYDMVVTDSDCDGDLGGFADGTTLGDNLVDYVNQGGVVVEYAYGADTSGPADEITGDWVSEGYSPLVAGANVNNNVTLGTHDASSPLMAGVSSLSDALCDTDSTLAPGATSVALWNTGQEAVAYKGQAIAVNASIEDGCQSSGDFARLTLNAVTWLGRPSAPVLGRTANVIPVSGLVFIKPPAGKSLPGLRALASTSVVKGQGFIPLTQARQVPIGSEIDARRGTLRIVVATRRRRHTQQATLAGALFTSSQTRSGPHKGLTTFALKESAFAGAPSYRSCTASKAKIARPGDAQIAKLSPKVLQTLKARDKRGKFRTKGRYSAATVRGTDWWTEERCDGTLTIVKRGSVSVFDYHTRKTIIVNARHSYLAKA